MDQLKAQLARIQEQLGALTASQKMLAASLVAVMVLSLLFWSRYAGTSEMEAVLDQSLKPDEIAQIVAQIRSQGIDAKVVNDRVMVPADRKLEMLAAISYSGIIPKDTHSTYDEILKRISPWDSQANTDATRNEAKARYISEVIRQFPNVANADVIIDPTNEKRIGGGGRQPTAMVQITLHDTAAKPEKTLVQAAAGTVAGAQSGLMMSNITVIVNGAKYPVADKSTNGSFDGDEMLEQQQHWEQWYTQKIQTQLGYISSALVTVSCDLNIKSEQRSDVAYDPKGTVQKESQSTNETNEQKTGSQSSAEPGAVPNASSGVVPNGGMSISPEGAGGTSSTEEKTSTSFENKFGSSKIDSITPGGKATVVGAAVSVPRSYIVSIWRSNQFGTTSSGLASEKGPDRAAIEATLTDELPHIRDVVKQCCHLKDDKDIAVQVYVDTPPLLAAATTTSVSSGGGVVAMLTAHAKEVGVSVLAIVGLFMVSNMVKKSAPVEQIVAAPVVEMKSTPSLSGLSDLAGDVSEGGAMLDGVEMDDASIRSQQVVEQVTTLVKENPDAAATLVKRWLTHA